MPDHVHLIIELSVDIRLSKVVGWCKGECSHFVNKQTNSRFYWQKGYQHVEFQQEKLDKHLQRRQEQSEFHKKFTLLEEIDLLKSGS